MCVFVTSIRDVPIKGIIVTATNGGGDGPPMIAFKIPSNRVKSYYIGKRLHIKITEDPQ